MKLRQLFENIYDVNEGGEEFDNSLKTIGVCFGRWNPPHKGHKAVWQSAATNPIWYVGTNQSTSGPKDPVPYDIKLQLMKAVWPKVAGHVIPEQSLLTLAARIYSEHGQNVHLKVYTDEEWLYKALSQYNGVEKEHGMYNFQQIDWVKTERLASATNLRAAVRSGDRKSFYNDMGIKPSVAVEVNGQAHPVFDVVAHFLNKYPEKAKKAAVVAEGDVVKFPKKHKGDLSDTHDCPKCGGDLQGGKYMGHEVKVCMPCKQVYLPPNSGIDQKGNKVVDEIAGAFPSPSTKAKWAADAAASNAAEAKRQEALKAQQLIKNTAEVDRLQKVNHHSLDSTPVAPTNESFVDSYLEDRAKYLAEVAMRMQGSSQSEKDANARAKALEAEEKAKHLAIVKAYVDIMAAGKPLPPKMQQSYNTMPEFRKEVDAALANIPGQPGRVDLEQRKNYHLMPKFETMEARLAEMEAELNESSEAKITKRKQQSTAGLNTYGDSEKMSGDYTAYRLGMAVAGANGKDPIDMKAKSWIGKKKSTHPYTQEEQDMLKQAYEAVGAKYEDLNNGDMKSRELDSTHKVSPVAAPKRNKYGV